MEKIHLIANNNAYGSLSYIYESSKDTKVFLLNDNLNYGPIVESEKDYDIRFKYLSTLHSKTNTLDLLEDKPFQIKNLNLSTDKDQEIYYYFTRSTKEQIYLRFINYYLKDYNLLFVDVNEVFPSFKSTAEISPEQYLNLKDKAIKFSNEKKADLQKQWEDLLKSDSVFRIFDDNTIHDLPEDYYDELILAYIDEDFKKASYVIGDSLSHINTDLSDLFIYYRITKLIEKKEIIAKENSKDYYNLLIKKNTK